MGKRNKNGVRGRGQNRRTLKSQRRLIYQYGYMLDDQDGYKLTVKGRQALQYQTTTK